MLRERHEPEAEATGTKQKPPQQEGGKSNLESTSRSEGWPKIGFAKNASVRGLSQKRYKFTFTNNNMEEHMTTNIEQSKIDVSNCFVTVEGDLCRKIREGLAETRTPPS